jgi:N-acetylmuramic acid 6-phosphate (MurNAc-6-P) etherase
MPLQHAAKAEAAPFPAVASDTAVLERILSNVAAANLLPRFIDDLVDDGDLGALAVTKASKLQAKYGLSDSQVAAFIAGCQQAASTAHGTADAPAVSSAAPYARTPRAPPPLPPLPSSFEQ